MSNEKAMIVHLIARLIKKDLIKQMWYFRINMSQYLPKPYEPFGVDINVKVDLSNYATKTDIKNMPHIDT